VHEVPENGLKLGINNSGTRATLELVLLTHFNSPVHSGGLHLALGYLRWITPKTTGSSAAKPVSLMPRKSIQNLACLKQNSTLSL
jgi:hypothetical protein